MHDKSQVWTVMDRTCAHKERIVSAMEEILTEEQNRELANKYLDGLMDNVFSKVNKKGEMAKLISTLSKAARKIVPLV
jgi:hypothetical protein